MKQIRTDIVIVGGGLAGLYTALNIDSTKRIDILLKGDFSNNNSALAQGGIAGEVLGGGSRHGAAQRAPAG